MESIVSHGGVIKKGSVNLLDQAMCNFPGVQSDLTLYPLINTLGFWSLGTKCWGKTLYVGTKHILPRCELPGN